MSILFEPAKIGNIEVKNRFIRSATYFGLADENGKLCIYCRQLKKLEKITGQTAKETL